MPATVGDVFRKGRTCGRRACLLSLVCVAVTAATTANAQIIINGVVQQPEKPEDTGTGPSTAFIITLDEELQNTLDDYSRYANRGLWEKAVETIEKLEIDGGESKLLAGSGGVILSAEERLRQVQTELSAEGREAFRLFLGPLARRDYAAAMAEDQTDAARVQTLQGIRKKYFPSSVGDNASNLLGDNAFRNRRFAEAANYYNEVLAYHPDSELPEHRLHYKRGLANLLAGRLSDARQSAETLARRFAGETTLVGGKPVDAAADLNRRLAEANPKERTPAAETGSESTEFVVAEPEAFEPAWQHQFITDEFYDNISQAARNSWRRPGSEYFVPPVAADESLVAVNYLGAVSAIDLQTGKLIWRDLDDADNWRNLQNDTDELNFDTYQISLTEDYVCAVAVQPRTIHYYGSRPELTVYNRKTGKQSWSTNTNKNGNSSDGWFVVGEPTEIDGDLYYIAGKSSGYEVGDIFLRKHSRGKSGGTDTRLGRYRSIANSYNGRIVPTPTIRSYDGEMLVHFDEGLLLGVDLDSLSPKWGYQHESRPVASNSNRYYGRSSVDLKDKLQVHGQFLVRGSSAFLKDAHVGTVTEFDLTTHRPVRTREVPSESSIVAVDDKRLFVLGESLTAYDRETGEVVWAKRQKRDAGGASAVRSGDSLFIFTDTGLFEWDATTGKLLAIRRGIDDAPHGGRVLVAGDRLLTVSPKAITAYPITRRE